jgi:hypothetical protein
VYFGDKIGRFCILRATFALKAHFYETAQAMRRGKRVRRPLRMILKPLV